MWWDQLKQSKHIDEKRVSWRQFKGYFQDKYLLEHYYERKMMSDSWLRLMDSWYVFLVFIDVNHWRLIL
jgi:hypothetical protein